MLSFKQDKEWKKYVKNALGLIVFFVNTICGYASEAKEEEKKEDKEVVMSIVPTGVQSLKAGNNTQVIGPGNVVIGENAKIKSESSVAIGMNAKVGKEEFNSLEEVRNAKNRNNVSIGYLANTQEGYGTALGARTRALGRFSTAIGSDAYVGEKGQRAIAVGARATIGESYKITSSPENGDIDSYDSVNNFIRSEDELINSNIKDNVTGEKNGQYASVAIGRYSHVTSDNSVAIGHMAEVTAKNAVAIGALSEVHGIENGIAVGSFSAVDRDKYIVGYAPETGKDREITGSEVDKIKEFNKILAKVERYKELGLKASKMTAEEKEEYDKLCDENIEYEIYNGKEIENRTDSVSLFYDDENLSARIKQLEKEKDKNNKTWRATSGAVSVGNTAKGITRQITNVAAGSEDTDVVNVAQLKSLATMQINFLNNGKYYSNNNSYVSGSNAFTLALNKLSFDFGEGIKATKVGEKDNERVLITLDKEYIKNNKDLRGPAGMPGELGRPGKDGLTPSINEKGNWQIGDKDTGVKAQVKELAQSSIQVKGQGKIKVTKENDGDKEVYTVTSTSQEQIGYKTKEGKELILKENELFVKDGAIERKATEEEITNHKAHLKDAKGKMDKEVKLSNIADGEISEKSTDAVNGRQVNRVRNEVRTALNQTNTRIDRLEENMARQNERIDNLRKDLNNGMAQLSAMSAVDFGHTKKHKVKVGAGIGGYKGARAVAVGVAVSPTDNLLINAKMSTPTNTIKGTSFGIGATYEFDYE